MTSQLSLLAPQDTPTARKRSRRRDARRAGPKCYVEGCERLATYRQTFTQDRGMELGMKGWKSVELCGTHARQLSTPQMYNLAK